MGTKEAIEYLERSKNFISDKKVMIGIDGFIDKVMRPVKVADIHNNLTYFKTIDEFGNFVADKAGMSCGIRITENITKIGGNGPIMSKALSSVGVNVTCVGTLGYPTIENIFTDSLGKDCELYSICTSGVTTILEFDDGKVMLGLYDDLQKLDWSTFKSILGTEKLTKFFEESNLTGLVNFAAITLFNDIMRGIIDEVISKLPVDKNKYLFFDTADVSKRDSKDILKLVDIMKEFNQYRKVIVGLNASEAITFYKAIFNKEETPDIKTIGDELYEALECDILVIHTLMDAMAWEKYEFAQAPSLFVNHPKLSTGGGDNFNAGLCFGFLLDMDLENALYVANATSGSYVRNAKSPSYDDLIQTLKDWDKLIETPNK